MTATMPDTAVTGDPVHTTEPAALADLDFTPWPDEVAQRYRELGHWRGETLGDWLRGLALEHGDRTALVDANERVSYAELDDRTDRLTARLVRLGVHRGDRVVVQLPNRAVFVPTIFALFRIGALPVFALPAHRLDEIRHLVRMTDAAAYVIADTAGIFDYRVLARAVRQEAPGLSVLVAGDPEEFTALEDSDDADDADDADGVREDGAADQGVSRPQVVAAADVAFLNLSGGSTGLPKLIPRTHDDYLYSVRESAAICGLDRDTTYLCALPVAHNFALSSPGLLGVLHVGGRFVLSEAADPATCFGLIESERVTITALVPPLAKLWLDAAAERGVTLPHLRTLQVGGARLSDEVAARVAGVLGCRLQQVFGMAEGLVNYTRDDDSDDVVIGTQGRPISPDDEVRVVDDLDRDLPDGEVGHLLTRGPYTIRGYYRAGAHNAHAFTADGFYRTGDLVRRLPGGHLVVEGRSKDQINRGGEKVAVEDLENHLLAHPAVLDAAVVPLPDPMLGERVCAVLVLRTGQTLSQGQVRGFVRGRGVAEFKIPDQVRFVDAFPVTGVGKVSRADLRRRLALEIASATSPITSPVARPGATAATGPATVATGPVTAAATTPRRRDITAELPETVRRAALAAGPPVVPHLPSTWSARLVEPGSDDARLVTDWMSRPHVARFWDQAWPQERWDAELAAQLAGDYSRPYLVGRGGEPFCYVELYRAARDVVARHYPARPEDVGVHLAIGDEDLTGRGLGSGLLRVLAAAVRARDPRSRLLMDPDERHDGARRAAVAAGFGELTRCDLGHKRAALLLHPLLPGGGDLSRETSDD